VILKKDWKRPLATSNPVIHPLSRISTGGMSHLGQERRICDIRDRSALHPIADISPPWRNRRFGPRTTFCTAEISELFAVGPP
jgi:hypothetical protein